jgi:hypothetical protein
LVTLRCVVRVEMLIVTAKLPVYNVVRIFPTLRRSSGGVYEFI